MLVYSIDVEVVINIMRVKVCNRSAHFFFGDECAKRNDKDKKYIGGLLNVQSRPKVMAAANVNVFFRVILEFPNKDHAKI